MAKRITRNAILKEIGNPLLNLYGSSAEGYFYWHYFDKEANIYETRSVYVYRLSDLSFDSWVEDGKNFLDELFEDD